LICFRSRSEKANEYHDRGPEFESPVAAVTCAREVQLALAKRAATEPEERRIRLRIGINFGDVVVRPDGDLYGDGVNVAARLEPLAAPGGIVIAAKVDVAPNFYPCVIGV
jgi:adenylate cyclase